MQIRQDQGVAQEELASFALHSQLKPSQFKILNVFETSQFDESVLTGMDSLWVGGASEANVLHTEKYPFVNSAQELLLSCCRQRIPVFASCFGFQLAVLALGGEIVDSPREYEMGTIPISLTEKAADDALLCDTPDQFLAVSVHKQKADRLPDNCQKLAYTDRCVHAFKLAHQPFWAFQFHPEVDRSILIERLTTYKKYYTRNDKQLDEVIRAAQETPQSNVLMKKFVDRVLLA